MKTPFALVATFALASSAILPACANEVDSVTDDDEGVEEFDVSEAEQGLANDWINNPKFADIHEHLGIGLNKPLQGCAVFGHGLRNGKPVATRTCFSARKLGSAVTIYPSVGGAQRVEEQLKLFDVTAGNPGQSPYTGILAKRDGKYRPGRKGFPPLDGTSDNVVSDQSRIGSKMNWQARVPKGTGAELCNTHRDCGKAVRFFNCSAVAGTPALKCTHRMAITWGDIIPLDQIKVSTKTNNAVVALNCFSDALLLLFGWQGRYPSSPASISTGCTAATAGNTFYDFGKAKNVAETFHDSLPRY